MVRIRKFDKYFMKKLDFKDIKLPTKIRDTHKTEKNKLHQHQCFGLSK